MSTIEEAREQAREALAQWDAPGGNHSGQVIGFLASALRALLDATEPRPITDEMVEAAAREYHERGNGEGSFARMSGHVRTSLLFRMKCALEAAEEARR